MPRPSNLIKLGDAIDQILKQEKLDLKLARVNVKGNWKDVVGEMIAKNTNNIFFKDKTIFIGLNSAALKHELIYRRREILQNINTYAGFELVNEIVIK